MLEASLFATAFALLPLVLSGFGATDEIVWRASAAGYLLVDVFATIYTARYVRSVQDQFDGADQLGSRVTYLLSFAGDLACLVVLAGVIPSQAPGLYAMALYLNVVAAGLLFTRFAASVFTTSR